MCSLVRGDVYLTGFLLPLTSLFFFRELPLPNFFDAEAEAAQSDETPVSERVAISPGVGAEVVPAVVFGRRTQVGRWGFRACGC